ncbi:hypothetical protein BDN72DRAFT_895167 [Pluteus cervinus]|uniref:Uncharacterized protein n=1 Tax=Pluteus cervinus TaxID=181527 RepID=A0ACD3B362_9AGAR|nr:hypothetical protein BDN72DRAFT_895167 [Pluteus cervinus]
MRPYPVLVNLPQEQLPVENVPSGSKDVLNPRDEEILKLVAADAPSHRICGAWKTFAFNITSSLPIAIAPSRPPRTPLTLASYRPRTEIPQQVGSAPAIVHKPSSSAFIHFTAEAADESNDAENDEDLTGGELVSVAHPNVTCPSANPNDVAGLKILQKQSELPSKPGMWRSFTS